MSRRRRATASRLNSGRTIRDIVARPDTHGSPHPESPKNAPGETCQRHASGLRVLLHCHYNIIPSSIEPRYALRTNVRENEAHSIMSLRKRHPACQVSPKAREGGAAGGGGREEEKKEVTVERRHATRSRSRRTSGLGRGAHDNTAERRAISLDTDCVPRV